MKKLIAVYVDSSDAVKKKEVVTGNTADFASAVGFYVEEVDSDLPSPNGLYPTLWWDDIRHLEGELLTICDAVFPEGKQLESTKSLVRTTLHAWVGRRMETIGQHAE